MGQDVAIHVRIGKDLRRRLDERADQERRSRSNMAALFIEDGLNARDARDALTAVGPQPELHGVLANTLVDTPVKYTTEERYIIGLQEQEDNHDLEDMQ